MILFCLALAASSATVGKLVWSDEFDYSGLPDAKKWDYDVGGNGWGNKELQFYTGSRTKNAMVANGVLKITVAKEDTSWKNSAGTTITNHLTSARLVTRGKASWTYGRFEARMKLPRGRGMWPAFWLIPTSPNPYGGWPNSGEIDVLENYGLAPTTMNGSLQTKNHFGATCITAHTLAEYANDSFHVYSVDWRPGTITISVDSQPYFRYANPGTGSADWPFDQPFYIILNVAVNGTWGDTTLTQTSNLPQSLSVDWVRVWQDSSTTNACCSLSVVQSPGGKVVASPVKAMYKPGEKVVIQATADTGFSFSRWASGVNSALWTDTLVMDGNSSLSATFVKSQECLTNGGFDQEWAGWRLWNDSTLKPNYVVRNGQGCVHPGLNDLQAWHVQIADGSFPVASNDRFQVSFVARAAARHTMNFRLSQAHEPFGALTVSTQIVVDTVRTRQSVLLDAQMADASGRIELNLANDSSEICFDSVSVRKLNHPTANQSNAERPRKFSATVLQGNLLVSSETPFRWILTTMNGSVIRSGRFETPGRHLIGKIQTGLGLLTIVSSDGSRETLRIASF